jgi:hypothetical protein
MVLAGAAAAQSVAPPAAEGEKPFGGFEPVLHLRTYYFDQESLTGAPASAWALGGWAGVRSPWWGDMFQVGVVGYTSLKLYGPDDKDGTRLLAPGQETIAIIGEAFGAVRGTGRPSPATASGSTARSSASRTTGWCRTRSRRTR